MKQIELQKLSKLVKGEADLLLKKTTLINSLKKYGDFLLEVAMNWI
jgi:hypothetical protein